MIIQIREEVNWLRDSDVYRAFAVGKPHCRGQCMESIGSPRLGKTQVGWAKPFIQPQTGKPEVSSNVSRKGVNLASTPS